MMEFRLTPDLTKFIWGYIIFYMWKIYEKRSLEKDLKRLPVLIRKHYEVWKRVIEPGGPQGLREIKGYHDEALKGAWKGFRSSRLNKQWRVIYKVESNRFEIFVVEVNPHEY